MIFKQYIHEQGGCLSYLMGCTQTGTCCVVDPQLDIEPYLDSASSKNLKITNIFETHAQADHLSGARRLAESSGASVHFHKSVRAAFPVSPLNDGDELMVGNIKISTLYTPGHTPDSVCYLVTDTTRSVHPWFILTGDTLFVADTGRPDLDGNAEDLYDSLYEKLMNLDDIIEIFPTHFAGSVCGRSISPKPSSTIGFERRFNPSLQFQSKAEFVQFVTRTLPVQPPRFHKVRQFNLGHLKEPPIEKTYDEHSLQITVEELKQRLDNGDTPFMLDVRNQDESRICSLGGHLIPLRELQQRMNELDPKQEIVVYCHTGNRSQTAVALLYEAGFPNAKNLIGGIDQWATKIDKSMQRY